MKKVLLVVLSVLSIGTSAFASGGTYCSADYGDINVQVSLVNSRMPGAPVVPGGSSVFVEQKGQGRVDFDVETDLVGWWSVDGDIKMMFLKQTEKGEVTLKVTTSYTDVHETHLGGFTYTNADGVEQFEIINCEAE